jgi:hypothetical protein
MKAYILTTGSLFGLIVIAHIARIIKEGTGALGEPLFVAMTILAIGLCVWAWRLFKMASSPRIQ